MAFRNPLPSRYAVLLGTSLAACGAGAGCNVYDDDELLRRPDNGGRSNGDAGSEGGPSLDGASRSDVNPRDAGDANVTDATLTDAPPAADTGTSIDVAAPDRATGDDGSTRADATTSDSAAPDGVTLDRSIGDANGASDVNTADAGFDATTGTRDADGAGPPLDASDSTWRDALDGVDARDGTTSAPDVDSGTPPPTIRVVRVGDGTAQLSAASAAVLLEERDWDGQLIGRPLALPTTASGAQQPLTLSGNATSEGALALSLDGRYLMLAGYATAPGRANIAGSNDVERVVARVDAAALIDTSTLLGNAFSGTNARSAASVDGTSFWVGGASGGVWYFPLGGAAGAQIVASPDNVRMVALYGDRLYGSSGSSPMTSVFTIGTGRPTSGVQSVAALTGMPQSGLSPYAFALFDRSAAVAGLDTLYLTDDRSPETDGTGGGIQKWTFDGSAWARVATFATVGGGTASFRGLAAIATSSVVTLLASSAESSANRLVVFVDDGSANPRGKVIATAPTNTIFRGVALSPRP